MPRSMLNSPGLGIVLVRTGKGSSAYQPVASTIRFDCVLS